jgi:hypothetical protein
MQWDAWLMLAPGQAQGLALVAGLEAAQERAQGPVEAEGALPLP